MPSYAEALQKMKGKLYPFGIKHFIHAKKHSKKVILYLIGVHPKYQNKGVHAIVFEEFHKTFHEKGIVECIRTPELVDNKAMFQLWTHYNPLLYKKRCTFRKEIN